MPIGAMALSRTTPGPFTDRQFDLVQERTRDLLESLQQQTATAEVLKVISRSAFDLDTVMNTLARSASELCGADSSVLQLRNGDYLVVRGVSAVDASVIDYVRQNPVRIDDQSYVGRAVLHGSIANIPDFERDTRSRLRNYHEKMGFKALLIVPLMTEGG